MLVGTASRWTAVVTMRRARASAVRRACASARRTWAAASFCACSTMPTGQLGAGVVRGEAGDRLELGERGPLRRCRAGRCGTLRLLQDPGARPARLGGRLGLGAGPCARARSISTRSAATDCSRSVSRFSRRSTSVAHRACRVLDGGDVRLRAGPLQTGLATGDEDEHEGHEAGAEQPDDRADGACVHDVLLVRPHDAQRCRCAGSGHCRAHRPPFGYAGTRGATGVSRAVRQGHTRPRRSPSRSPSAVEPWAASSSRTSRATSPGGYPWRPSAANVRRDRVCASSPEVEASLRRTRVRAAASSSSRRPARARHRPARRRSRGGAARRRSPGARARARRAGSGRASGRTRRRRSARPR